MQDPSSLEIEAANLALGRARGTRLREAAEEALTAGEDSPALRRLAGLSEGPPLDEAVPLFEDALSELGLAVPDAREASLRLARALAARILSGELPPYQGARQIWDLSVDAGQVPDLDPFVYAASEWEDRPEDRPIFDRAIRVEARELLGGL